MRIHGWRLKKEDPKPVTPPSPQSTPQPNDVLPLSEVVGDEGGAGSSAGGEMSSKSGAGLGRWPILKKRVS